MGSVYEAWMLRDTTLFCAYSGKAVRMWCVESVSCTVCVHFERCVVFCPRGVLGKCCVGCIQRQKVAGASDATESADIKRRVCILCKEVGMRLHTDGHVFK